MPYDRYYFDRFLTAVSVILQKQLLNKYNSSTLRTDLDEIIKRLFAMSGINPLDIENTYNNSVVTLSPIDQSKIDSIVNPPPTPPPTPPTTTTTSAVKPRTPSPTTTSAVKPRTPSPTTTSAVQPRTPSPTTTPTTPTYCDTSSNSGCVVSGGRKKTRKSRKSKKGKKKKKSSH